VTGLVPGLEYAVLALVGPMEDPTLAGYREPAYLPGDGPVEVTIELMTRAELEALRR